MRKHCVYIATTRRKWCFAIIEIICVLMYCRSRGLMDACTCKQMLLLFKYDRKGLIKSATTTSQFQHSVGVFSAIWLVVRSTFNGPSTSVLPLSLFLLRSIRVPYTCTPQKRPGRANFSSITIATAVTTPKETKDEQALSTASSKQCLSYYPVFASNWWRCG